MSSNTHSHVRVVDATFVEEKREEPAHDDAPDPHALKAQVAKDIAIAVAPVAGVLVAGFALYAELDALWKHAKRNARRRTIGVR